MKILIVDADTGSASSLAKWLVLNGWPEPGLATTSDDAVDWVNKTGGLDVLITEVAIQPADGLTLHETLKPHLHHLRTVFLATGDVSALADRMAGCRLLQKPVAGEALDAAIRSLFEPPPQTVADQPKPVAATPRVATAQPTAQPRAVSATPKAAQPSVQATPRAVAATAKPAAAQPAKATPVAAKPTAAKAAVASASPRPAAAQAAPAQAPQNSSKISQALKTRSFKEVEMFPDALVGKTLGQYHIEAKIGMGRQGGIYRATQTNMARQVRFYALDAAKASDPAQVERFISNASVKANVNNSNVFAIYEAGESDGIYFYTCEYEPCSSLAQNRESGVEIDELLALRILKVAADVLGSFARNGTTHEMVTERSILLGSGGRCWIANIAAHEASQPFDTAMEMVELAKIAQRVLPQDQNAGPNLGVRALLERVAAGEGPASWPALYQELQALEPKVAPQDAYKLDAQERAAIRMVEETKKRQKRSMLISSAVSLILLTGALVSVYIFLNRGKGATVLKFDKMIEIPAGEFIYQDNQKVTLPKFYIDEHEVTIGQYAEFLDFLEKNPKEADKFAHPNQSKGKSHVPEAWADQELATGPMPGYYTRAKRWGKYKEAPLDVNSPVFGVDWFDAYAYAKWKGHRLPTEQEWEKAARGTKGFLYPWGEAPDPKRANTGADVKPNPKEGGDIDGFRKWSPVNGVKGDKSPFGVIGMAGNVGEWTDSWDTDPQSASAKVPVIRGGNYTVPDHVLTRRVLTLMEYKTSPAIGFRTASDAVPQP